MANNENLNKTIQAIDTLTTLTSLIASLASRLQDASAMIAQAQAEKRDITEEELDSVQIALYKAHSELKEALKS